MMIVNRLPELLEKRFGGKPNMLQVQHETGLAYGTINSWIKDKINRVDFPTLEVWCKYLDCQPGDLLVYEAKQE